MRKWEWPHGEMGYFFIGNVVFGPDTIKAMAFEGKLGARDYGEKQFDVLFKEGYVSFQFDYHGMI